MRGKRAKQIRHEVSQLSDKLATMFDINKSQKAKERILYRKCKKAWNQYKVMPNQLFLTTEE